MVVGMFPGKLVRDRIPEIIRQSGSTPIVRTARGDEYAAYVNAKLTEELDEYLGADDVTELADLVEVCFAAAALHGVSRDDLLEMARRKRESRGGFDRRVVWLGNHG
jgi:predicted house-cleaning noncanonical NTP pyrophosphatase (MazG superfamily)